MQDSRMLSEYESSPQLPRKQEWALIYNQKAKEVQLSRALQKRLSAQKKNEFKMELEKQINQKKDVGISEKEEDRKYYQLVTRQAEETKQEEARRRLQKYARRRKIEHDNHSLAQLVDDRAEDAGKVYNIEIGYKSEQERKLREENSKLLMMDALDKQTQMKELLRRQARQQQYDQQLKNEQYQLKAYANRTSNHRKYEQDPLVYNHYRDINNLRLIQHQELERKLIQQAAAKKDQQDLHRRKSEQELRERNSLQMRDTLEKQVNYQKQRKLSENRTNPEENSYRVISSMFTERKPNYDKQEYSRFLERQTEEQRLRKLQSHYMSDEQYKLNSNQLNKALHGTYAHDKYYDRSLASIGDKHLTDMSGGVEVSEDAEIIKAKLEKNRRVRGAMSPLI